MEVDWDGNSETITSKSIEDKSPTSGWENFSKKLLGLQIITLPDSNDIPGYESGNDGNTYSVEIATPNQYRFYNYWTPSLFQDSLWQAKNMVDIITLLDKELGVRL